MDGLTFPLQTGRTGVGLFLAMDTAAKEGSLAIGRRTTGAEAGSVGLEVVARARLGPEEEHAACLMPRIGELMEDMGVGPEDLDGFVVGAGPGSFTGVRIGAATAKGMAWSTKKPLWAFSSLAGAAADVDDGPLRPRLVLFDARGDRVYAAAFRFAHGVLETLVPPQATTIGVVLDELIPPGAVLMGDGAVRHQALLEGAGNQILPPPAGLPSAVGLLRILSLDLGVPPVADPGSWEPDYLRESGAERMWKTRGHWKGP